MLVAVPKNVARTGPMMLAMAPADRIPLIALLSLPGMESAAAYR
jgi:hypothetical protein